jgi:hypothetical protein
VRTPIASDTAINLNINIQFLYFDELHRFGRRWALCWTTVLYGENRQLAQLFIYVHSKDRNNVAHHPMLR